MRFELYINSSFIKDFLSFKELNGKETSRVICCMINNFMKSNISLDIPTIRKILATNPSEIRKLKELLSEFG